MQQTSQLLRELPTDPAAACEVDAIATLSDAQLVQAVADAISRPKMNGGNSFTLHAPMELLARAALLAVVPPEARRPTRMRIAAIAALYAAHGDEIEPLPKISNSISCAKEALVEGLREYDPDKADAALIALASQVSAHELCGLLTDEIVPRLGAGVHAPILLAALPEAAIRYGDLSLLLRASIRTLATAETLSTDPNPRLSWIDQPEDLSGPTDLWEALADPPRVVSASFFIAPTMLAVEADGLAARQLGRATQNALADLERLLMRIAALSMLQDEPRHAPYGWSHCLTVPQGIMALAPYVEDATKLVRIAATAVLGFRSTLGKARLENEWEPTAFHDVATLAARAAIHEDAHLAKYTVACLTAAAADPAARPLFLAAADYLGTWWDAQANRKIEG